MNAIKKDAPTRQLTMNEYILGTIIGFMIVNIYYQMRLTRQIDTLGEMLHVMLFHPDELEAWEGITSLELIKVPNEDESDGSWTEWDENADTHEEET